MQQQNSSFLIGPEETSRACLLIHGFSGTPAEMLALGKALAAQGLRVYGIALAGHDGDPENMLKYGHKDWIASVEDGLAQLDRYPHVFVAGLSMGGVLALLLALRHPERIKGVIAMSTPARFSGWQMRVVPLVRYFIKWFYPLEKLDFNDPKVQATVLKEARLRDPTAKIDFADARTVTTIKQMIRIPIPALAELLHLTNMCRRQLGRLTAPLLIIQSKIDHTVDPKCADELYQLTRAAATKSLHWLERSDHVITTGPERDEVYALAIQFIHQTTVSDATIAQTESAQQAATGENLSPY